MKDVASRHLEILNIISQYQNGAVSDTMARLGLNYPVNFGLSLLQVDKIASEMDKDNQFAFYLWTQKERESKLIALRILEPSLLSPDEINLLINGVSNIELAEQTAKWVFSKLDNIIETAENLFKLDNYSKLLGYNMIYHKAKEDKAFINRNLDEIFELIKKYSTNNNAIYLKRAVSNLLLLISSKNENTKNRILDTINNIKKTNPELSDFLDQEVRYFILSFN